MNNGTLVETGANEYGETPPPMKMLCRGEVISVLASVFQS